MSTARRFPRPGLVRSAVAALATLLLVSAAPTGAASAAPGDVTISGHGYGHGRGMSQWGAYGYAVDLGADHASILDHYYGGTTAASDAGNPVVSVELLSLRNRETVLTGPDLTLNGAPIGRAAVRIRGVASNTFEVLVGDSCSGPWTVLGATPRVSSGATVGGEVRSCESGQVRAYRGTMSVVDGGGFQTTVNNVSIDDYLRGVVPREMPASWANAGGGRGAEAVKVQAVAARSYALASQWTSYAKTCDTTSCQVYGGAYTQPFGGAVTWLEDSRTNSAIAATSGQVRRTPGGAVVRTEFSSSSGGFTAGGAFPAVEDRGDATAGNPNHNWSVSMSLADIGNRLGLGSVTGIAVTQANGLGPDGGRALQVTVSTAGGSRTYTGNQIRSALGLKSDWFTFTNRGASAMVQALYADVLGRPADAGGVSYWTAQLASGQSSQSVAQGFAASSERFGQLVRTAYVQGLRRAPDPGGLATFTNYLSGGGSPNELTVAIWSTPEAVQAQGGDRLWIEGLYQALLGRSAGEDERDFWQGRLASGPRAAVVREITTSAEARELRLGIYYQVLLGRAVDAGGRASFLPALAQRGDVDVVAALASSAEYAQRAAARFP
ncbi:SpoIID/LytB domain protein [Klenkia marina]|uniref:SpoIID/LytB domain protein n=1 Tax=Klenkia marina TaxID=1960309 RepID=A0A1G4YE44_9ACTN|nr:SpoIID/LytB domain-containing protein [Klenkia marina]SCX51776.1 SpoIID/LytB domain protein [Klenkia marina]